MPYSKATIRMYNVGFGDAFLVTLASDSETRRILFDCGSVAAGPQSIADVVGKIIKECTDAEGKAHIDVVVATHRHKDHVSGFAVDSWSKVEVGEVWMPWTEDPDDPEAGRIRDAQAKLTAALAASLTTPALDLAGLSAEPNGHDVDLGIAPTLVLNAMSNAKAMDTLHSGFLGVQTRRFLPEKDGKGSYARVLASPMLPGVKVHVLGPSHDPDVIADMDPPKGKSYLRLKDPGNADPGATCRPFNEEYLQDTTWAPDDASVQLSPEELRVINDASGSSDFDAATALDNAVNGTSLMLVLEIGKTFLFFPGDAQWGTWNVVLNDPEWRQLLGKTRFYKVGHHGSHNATPIDFVESTISEGIVGMASTMERSIWPSIPKTELLAALDKKKAKIARSDHDELADATVFSAEHDHYVETTIIVP